MNKIKKIVVFYEDGTFEELVGGTHTTQPGYSWPVNNPPAPTINWKSCAVCGDPSGHRGMRCPVFTTTYSHE